jgi:protein-S-isoprenylcysteine O-methyltransferase Ste14
VKTTPTVLLAAALLVTGLTGGLRSLLSAEPGGYAVPVVAAAALTGLVGFTWQQSRARARRWKAALDAYADREIARAGAQ